MEKSADYPSQIAPKFTIRFPEGMREEIARIAEKNHRSMRAEIIARLEDSLRSELRVSEQQGDYAVNAENALVAAFRAMPPNKKAAMLELFAAPEHISAVDVDNYTVPRGKPLKRRSREKESV